MRTRDTLIAMAFERLEWLSHPGGRHESPATQPRPLSWWIRATGLDGAEPGEEVVRVQFPAGMDVPSPHTVEDIATAAMRRMVREMRTEKIAGGWRRVPDVRPGQRF